MFGQTAEGVARRATPEVIWMCWQSAGGVARRATPEVI